MTSLAGYALDGFVLFGMTAWLTVAAAACFCVYHSQRDRPPVAIDRWSPTVVIIPIRGVPRHLDALWRALSAQTYHPIRTIFAVESTDDPAYAALASLSGGPPVEIVVAGSTTQRSQKVHNQLAALRTLQPDDAIIVFADADIVPAEDWLARLVRGLPDSGLHVCSGYRWMVPSDNRWSTAFVCVINSSIATTPQRRWWSAAWGGSMALRRQAVDELDLEKCWEFAASDDMRLTCAVRARGGQIHVRRDVLVLSPIALSWADAIRFGRRQYQFVRINLPRQWLVAAGATTLPLIGWAVTIPLAVTGDKVALAVILAANVLDHIRARLRLRIPRKLWGMEIPRRVARLDRWGTPAWLAVHALVIWSTLFGRKITWAGRTYWLDRRQRVYRIMDASGA